MELRCENGILFGLVLPDGLLEFKCRSRRCGAGPGVVVLHRFDSVTGKEVEGSPKLYRDPAYDKEDRQCR
jgi:hypothetical protein